MELYQIVWGVFALVVLWSVFFMPPLGLPPWLYAWTLKAQRLLILAGAFSLFFIGYLFWNTEGFWAAYADIMPVGLVFHAGILLAVAYFSVKSIAAVMTHVLDARNNTVRQLAVSQMRYPFRPDTETRLRARVLFDIMGLEGVKITCREFVPLPYEDARPARPNASAIGCVLVQKGFVSWAAELRTEMSEAAFSSILIHEAAHIKNNDSLRKQMLRFLVLLALFSCIVSVLLGFVGLQTLLLVAVLTYLLPKALNRKYEALADYEAVKHGYGEALVNALTHIDFEGESRERTSHLMGFTRTHPPTEWRIRALRACTLNGK